MEYVFLAIAVASLVINVWLYREYNMYKSLARIYMKLVDDEAQAVYDYEKEMGIEEWQKVDLDKDQWVKNNIELKAEVPPTAVTPPNTSTQAWQNRTGIPLSEVHKSPEPPVDGLSSGRPYGWV